MGNSALPDFSTVSEGTAVAASDLMRIAAIVALLSTAGLVVACSSVDPYGDMTAADVTTKADKTESAATCSAGIAGADPTALVACTGTKTQSKGRCVPKGTLGSFSDTFESADCKGDAACLPEELVKQGTKIELKKCNAVLNTDGRCFWPLAKQVIENYDLLKSATKDQCEGDQICAPCTDPRTQEATGVCTLGAGSGDCKSGAAPEASGGTKAAAPAQCPQVEPILDESAFKQDSCGSNMLCVDASLVGADRAKLLGTCSTGVCAPKKSVLRGGNYVPKSCRSLAGAEGRCSNVGVPDVAKQKDLLPQADCDADERCAPCFDPTSGKETGACSQATCDKPAEKPVTFAACCGGGGKCVPTASAGPNADQLNPDSCSGDTPVCAPNAFLPGATPKTCDAVLGIVKGICAAKCAVDVPGGGVTQKLIQGSCSDDEFCVPCSRAPAGTAACNK